MIQPPADTSLLTANQILVRLEVQRYLIAAVLVLTVILVAGIVALVPRAWTSSTDIYIDYRENDPISGMRFSAMLDDSYMRTQLELIRSRVVTEQVIETLGLQQTASYREALRNQSATEVFEDLVRRIQRNTLVTTAANSRVITVSYTAGGAEQARDYADAIVAAYLQVTRDMTAFSAGLRTEQYRRQIEQLRQDAEAAQQSLTRYQQDTGILTIGDAVDTETRRFNDILATQYELQNQWVEAQARNLSWQALLNQGVRPRELPEIGRMPQMVEIQARYTDAIRRLAEKQAVLGNNHPAVRSLRDEIQRLDAMQGQEARSILETQMAAAEALREQLLEIDMRLEQQRERVLTRLGERDRLTALQRQLNSAEQIYQSALKNYDSLVLASSITPHNITVLRPASLPSFPSRPKVMQSLLASLFIGLFLGVCLALIMEFLRRRLRCLDDLLRTVPAPALGRIGLPDSRLGEVRR